jgi:hypothetical protein
MKYRRFPFLAIMLLLPLVASAGPREETAQMVRALGYGGAIHQFKNYLMRGEPRYREAADRSLAAAQGHLDALARSAELDAGDKAAVRDLKATVGAYQDALQRVTELRREGLTPDLVDRLVLIDDAAAVAALEALRANWQWSDFEEMEYRLGYGQAIDAFKNFVLRGQERYHAAALEHLLAVDALIATQLAADGVGDGDRAALERLERVVHGYRDYLPLVDKLHAMQRPVRQIDLAVKVNDGPGTAGLAQLRKAGGYLEQARR